ncbi:MAG: prepilin-type N-terminal cleavage/methylation domain-containing protein [Patescibacteria group bacterium]|jgi:prepilin-type N-terminal cleavage/methylation domain-containing protein
MKHRGFTLIEVVVALGVVTTGVIAGMTLTSYNLNISSTSESRLVASNLAREGIEVVRWFRDSNWLANLPWNQSIVEVGKYRLTVDFDEANNTWATVSQIVDLDACTDCQIYLDAATGVFSHNNIGTNLTSYKRLISLKEICWQEAVGSEAILANGQKCSDVAAPLIGYEVSSQVSWNESGKQHLLEAVDRLYDWK